MGNLLSNKGLQKLTKENTSLTNCMMAVFMGGNYDPEMKLYSFVDVNFVVTECDTHLLEFHISWDWLIPVCQKWDQIEYNELDLVDYEMFNSLSDELDDVITLYDINEVYNQLVKNLNWYHSVKMH
jgi:hypothetical protein